MQGFRSEIRCRIDPGCVQRRVDSRIRRHRAGVTATSFEQPYRHCDQRYRPPEPTWESRGARHTRRHYGGHVPELHTIVQLAGIVTGASPVQLSVALPSPLMVMVPSVAPLGSRKTRTMSSVAQVTPFFVIV